MTDEQYENAASFWEKKDAESKHTQEEVRNIFAPLKYAVENNIQINITVGRSYSSSNKY